MFLVSKRRFELLRISDSGPIIGRICGGSDGHWFVLTRHEKKILGRSVPDLLSVTFHPFFFGAAIARLNVRAQTTCLRTE